MDGFPIPCDKDRLVDMSVAMYGRLRCNVGKLPAAGRALLLERRAQIWPADRFKLLLPAMDEYCDRISATGAYDIDKFSDVSSSDDEAGLLNESSLRRRVAPKPGGSTSPSDAGSEVGSEELQGVDEYVVLDMDNPLPVLMHGGGADDDDDDDNAADNGENKRSERASCDANELDATEWEMTQSDEADDGRADSPTAVKYKVDNADASVRDGGIAGGVGMTMAVGGPASSEMAPCEAPEGTTGDGALVQEEEQEEEILF